MNSLVLVLVLEGFVDAFRDGLAVEDEAFCDRRLWIYYKTIFFKGDKYLKSDPLHRCSHR